MMFNNNKLPLNKMQKLQKQASHKQKNIVRDHELDNSMILAYQQGNEDAGFALLLSYIDIVSYIYRNPHKAQFKNGSKINIDWTPQDKEDLIQEIAYHFFTLVDEHDPEVGNFEGLIKGKLHLRVYNNFFEDVAKCRLNEIALNDELDFENNARSVALGDVTVTAKLPVEYLEMYQAFNQLSPNERAVLECTIVKGWNASETATELELKPINVRVIKLRALGKLQKIMKKDVA